MPPSAAVVESGTPREWNDRNPAPWNQTARAHSEVRLSQNLRWQSVDGADLHRTAKFHAPGEAQEMLADHSPAEPAIEQVQYNEADDSTLSSPSTRLRVVQGTGPELIAPGGELGDELFLMGPANAASPTTHASHPLFVPARRGAAPIVMLPPDVVAKHRSGGVRQATLLLSEADGTAYSQVQRIAQRPAPAAKMLAQADQNNADASTDMDFQELFGGEAPPDLPERPKGSPRATTPPRTTVPPKPTPDRTSAPSQQKPSGTTVPGGVTPGTTQPRQTSPGTAVPNITFPKVTNEPEVLPPKIEPPVRQPQVAPRTRPPVDAVPRDNNLFAPRQTDPIPAKPPATTPRQLPRPIPKVTEPAPRDTTEAETTEPEAADTPNTDLFESLNNNTEPGNDAYQPETPAPEAEVSPPDNTTSPNDADFRDLFPAESDPVTEGPATEEPATPDSSTGDEPTNDNLFPETLPSDTTPAESGRDDQSETDVTPLPEESTETFPMGDPTTPEATEEPETNPLDSLPADESPGDAPPDIEELRRDLFRDEPADTESTPEDPDTESDEAQPAKCDRVYNERNCCTVDSNCDRIDQFLKNATLDKISLEVSPTMTPGEDSPEKAAETRAKNIARIPSRTWMNRQGQIIATGNLHDLKNGKVIVKDEAGSLIPVHHLDLGKDELCFLNAWWGLPNECMLPDGEPPIRNWTMITYTWKASALCHKPTYFEDTELERYGHSPGPVLEPVFAGAHFFTHVVLLPYNMRLHTPNECLYTLGHYRPGSCAPWLVPAFPLSGRAAASQTLSVLGIWGILH